MIEKNIRLQSHHPRDLLVGRRSDNKRPKYQPPGRGGRSGGPPSQGGGAPSGGGGRRDSGPTRDRGGPPSISSRPAPAPRPVTTAVAPPSILSKVDPVDIEQGFVPGDVIPVKKHIPPVRHHEDTEETKEEQRQLDIQQMIAKQQEEKYGVGADPTKLGEIAKPDLRTEKETEEDWERAQDWDKIQKLSDRGYSSEEIQGAMEKGLLTKADPQSMRTNLLGRGLRSLRNIMPGTNLEESLLGNLKSKFNP